MNDKLELPEIQLSEKYRPGTGRSSLNNGFFLRCLSGSEPEVSCWKKLNAFFEVEMHRSKLESSTSSWKASPKL